MQRLGRDSRSSVEARRRSTRAALRRLSGEASAAAEAEAAARAAAAAAAAAGVRGVKLTSEEFDLCGEAFNTHVLQNGFGRIDNLWKLRNVLQALGQCPTDAEMRRMLPHGDSCIEFDEFIRTIEAEKGRFFQPPPPDYDTVQAFVAMGGSPEKEGEVSTSLLRTMVRDFDLRLDIDKLIEEVDTDGSGEITYEEFAHMFNNAHALQSSPGLLSPPTASLHPPALQGVAAAEGGGGGGSGGAGGGGGVGAGASG
eukprot:Rhum_TRINITY_DN461_c0_g1::Rhum_TRINITY_DN461_c0_g1_i1::g.1402::m.1402/K02183/CALM; calmodulin